MGEKGYNRTRCRLDLLLVERGLVPGREQARRLVMAGQVQVGGMVRDKPGTLVDRDAILHLQEAPHPYVSRGGVKLEHALDTFSIAVDNAVAIDAGASTGGFTDCLLSRGAARVYAVDVGYGQLAWKLRNHPRVVVQERTNVRYLGKDEIPEPVDLITVDLSFISVTMVLPQLAALLAPGGQMVILVKPQFEAGKGRVGKGGVVRDPLLHRQVLFAVIESAARAGLAVCGISPSPLRGPAGNVEFLLWLRPVREQGERFGDLEEQVAEAVEQASRISGGGA